MKRTLIFISIAVGIIGIGFIYRYFASQPNVKIYVAVEGEGKIVAFDPETRKIISTIDLSVNHKGGKLVYAPHNVQVSPDMKTVWVTANVGKHQDHSFRLTPYADAHGGEAEEGEFDEVIVINPQTDKIIKRIPIGAGLHLAHVVLTPDSALALVTAQNDDAIFKINAGIFVVEKKISVRFPDAKGALEEPHGIRISQDGATAYVAILKGKGLGILDLKTDALTKMSLGGEAVQTGVTQDGKYVVVSLYDTKELAAYRTDTQELKTIALPQGAKGPIQMYPTPDSKFVYLADQGYYFDQPIGEFVYKIDLENMMVVKAIKAGQGPHGVVVSENGAYVYVTNLLSGDVSIINTVLDDAETGRVKVGKAPNGISIWVQK